MPYFSPREQDILHLMADLHTHAEIASILGIKRSTLGAHIYHIVAKTGIHKQIPLAKYALKNGYGSRFKSVARGEEFGTTF